MVVFSLKLLNNVRKAIAGRRFPRQLAGGVALGALLGIVPHGNLLALFVLTAILCFQVNHALMAVVAIAVSFTATRLDPYSHLVGELLLNHPTGRNIATQAWALPVVPWTDLNNTVVLGSFVIGLAATLPIYYLTLPIFKLIAPAESDEDSKPSGSDTESGSDEPGDVNQRADAAHPISAPKESPTREVAGDGGSQKETAGVKEHSVTLYVDAQEDVPPPRFAEQPDSAGQADSAGRTEEASSVDSSTVRIDNVLTNQPEFRPAAEGDSTADSLPSNEQMVAVETRIDVIRMKDFRDESSTGVDNGEDAKQNQNEQPMDEALNYLLRQLRHSQERKAAG